MPQARKGARGKDGTSCPRLSNTETPSASSARQAEFWGTLGLQVLIRKLWLAEGMWLRHLKKKKAGIELKVATAHRNAATYPAATL
jgi:hypothetical protein